MAVAALVLGLIGLLSGLIPLLFFIAFPCGILAVVFGFVGRNRAVRRHASGKGMSIAGLVLGVLAVVLGVVGLVLINKAVDEIGETISTFEPSFDSTPLEPSSDPETPESLATDTSISSETSTADDAPPELSIESGFTPNTERGVVSAAALVTNNGDRTVCGVEIQFTILNSAGTPVDTETSRVSLIPAGQTVGVSPLQIGYQVADPASMEVSVVGVEDQIDSDVLADCSGFYLEDGIKVEVLNPVLTRNLGVSIDGQLSNPSDLAVDQTFITCVLKLAGKVVGGESSMSLDPIAPGGTIAFSLGFITYEGEADEILCTGRA
jgi:hypothetical protein